MEKTRIIIMAVMTWCLFGCSSQNVLVPMYHGTGYIGNAIPLNLRVDNFTNKMDACGDHCRNQTFDFGFFENKEDCSETSTKFITGKIKPRGDGPRVGRCVRQW